MLYTYSDAIAIIMAADASALDVADRVLATLSEDYSVTTVLYSVTR